MTAKQLTQWIRSVSWILIGVCIFLAVAVTLNETRSGAWLLAGMVACLVWFHVRVRRYASVSTWSVHLYFAVVNRTILAMCFALASLIGFLVAEELADKRLGLLEALIPLSISVHQAARGYMMAIRRWRSRADIYSSLRGARSRLKQRPLPKPYDFGFFVSASILSGLVGRYFGYEYSVLAGAVLMALTVPFLVGLTLTSSRLLRAYIPVDETIELG